MSEIQEFEKKKIIIKQNVESLRSEMDRFAAADGFGYRTGVTLLAATKTVPAELINYATKELGITDIGENRVQELHEKYDALEKEGVNIHFIGQLQKNKVKYIIDKVCMIQSLDSDGLAAEIDRQAKKIGKVMDVLIEINSGREQNKGGIMPEDLEEFLENMEKYENIRVRGLMTIAPNVPENEISIYFSQTFQLFIDILLKKIHNIYEPILSMGMSESYLPAINNGSNMVRIGSGIFGERVYPV